MTSTTFRVDEMQPRDIEEATDMRLQSWLDTYENPEFGVSRDWIVERNSEQQSPERKRSRLERFTSGKASGLFNAWVALDTEGRIIGSATVLIDEDDTQYLGSMYVDKSWHGAGVGNALMEAVLGWFDPSKPIRLEVVKYNLRAQSFYRKWGFREVPGSESLYEDKIPQIEMVRSGWSDNAQEEVENEK